MVLSYYWAKQANTKLHCPWSGRTVKRDDDDEHEGGRKRVGGGTADKSL